MGPSPSRACLSLTSLAVVLSTGSVAAASALGPPELPSSRVRCKLPGHPYAISPDDRWVVVKAGNKLALYNTADGSQGIGFDSKTYNASTVVFSPDGRAIVATGYNVGTRLLSTETGKEIRALREKGYASAVAYSPDGSRIASIESGTTLYVWRAAGGEPRKAAIQAKSNHSGLAFGLDGETLVTFGQASLFVWDAERLEVDKKMKLSNWGKLLLPRGKGVVTLSQYGSTLQVCRAADGTITHELTGHTQQPSRFCARPSGDAFASSNGKELFVWHVGSGSLVLRLPCPNTIEWAAFASDGDSLLTYSGGELRSWDMTVLDDARKRQRYIAYFDGGSDNYARHIRLALAGSGKPPLISYLGPKAGHTVATVTDRHGMAVEAVAVAIGNHSLKSSIPVRIGATSLRVPPRKIKRMDVLACDKKTARVKLLLADGTESTCVIDTGEVKGRSAFGSLVCPLADVAHMALDSSAANEKAEKLPVREDAPVRAEITDIKGYKIAALDLKVTSGREGHVLPFCVGPMRLTLEFRFLRRVEILHATIDGVIAKVTLIDDRDLPGFIRKSDVSTLSGKAGLGDFSLALKDAKSITFR